MVHVATLLSVFLHALQHSHVDKSVGEQQTEVLSFHCLELGFVLGCSLHFLGSAFPFCLLVLLLHQLVVGGSEVGGAYIVGTADVLASGFQHSDGVAP